MDRDNRWDRVKSVSDLIVKGEAGYRLDSALRGLKAAYERGAADKFELPTAVLDGEDQTVTLDPDDPVVFMNSRPDSTRKISKAITSKKFASFDRNHDPHQGYFCTLTAYLRILIMT